MNDLSIKDTDLTFFNSAFAFSDLDGNLTYVNNSFLTMWGYDDDSEVLGKNAVTFWHDRKSASRVLEELCNRGQFAGEQVAERKDGSTFDMHFTANLFMDNAGKPLSIMGSFVDITAHKSAEKAIRLERNNLISILNSIKDGIYIVNQQNDIEYVNTALNKEYGSSLGRRCYEYLHDRKAVCPWCKNKDVFA